MLDVICHPLGQFLYFIYNTLAFRNYGFAIIIFTVVVKLVLLPLTVKQYRSTSKMQLIQPQIQEIQKRYKNDKEKLNQEMMKVYQENSVNPAGGCLPLLVQMPILLSLYWVVIEPLKFMLSKTPEQITKIVSVAKTAMEASHTIISKNAMIGNIQQLASLNFLNENRQYLDKLQGVLNTNELINFNFLGLHLGIIPSYKTSDLFGPLAYIYLPLILLPIIGVMTTFLSTKLSMPKNKPDQANQQNAMASSMSNSMLYVGPVMTLFISFQVPASVVLYWIVGYVFTIFQQLYINKHIIKKNEALHAVQKAEKERQLEESKQAQLVQPMTRENQKYSKNSSKNGNNKGKGGKSGKSK